MSKFVDLIVRQGLNEHMLTLGTGGVGANERTVDLSSLGFGNAPIQITNGESGLTTKLSEKDWVEPFVVKSPQSIYTPSKDGLSRKQFQYTIWVKTDKDKDVYYNEALSGMIETHFPNNFHIKRGHFVITILKTYQQASITMDSNAGRLYNRVFVDCEIYYKNN